MYGFRARYRHKSTKDKITRIGADIQIARPNSIDEARFYLLYSADVGVRRGLQKRTLLFPHINNNTRQSTFDPTDRKELNK
jgi:hypothetical protein